MTHSPGPRPDLQPLPPASAPARLPRRFRRVLAVAACAAALALFTSAPVATAQPSGPTSPQSLLEGQVLGRGFDATKAYTAGRLDAVSTFNGNLTLRVPLGQTYTLPGGFQYGLALHYNSNAWNFEVKDDETWEPGECPVDALPIALPSADDNAGLGWRLSLGEFYSPRTNDGIDWHFTLNNNPSSSQPSHDGLGNQSDGAYLFVEPDGTRRHFVRKVHPLASEQGSAVYYSADGSFLRARIHDSGAHSHTAYIDRPDGTTYVFEAKVPAGGGEPAFQETWNDGVPKWRLREIYSTDDLPAIPGILTPTTSDRYRLRISYPDPDTWEIRDRTGRVHTVRFQAAPGPQGTAYPKVARVVDRVDLAGFGGTRLVYELAYSNQQLTPPEGDQAVHLVSAATRGGFPLLTEVRIAELAGGAPSPEPHSFRYYTPATPHPSGVKSSGLLAGYTVPTGGEVDFTYRGYRFPGESSCPISTAAACRAPALTMDVSVGVGTRTATDPLDVTDDGTWHYFDYLPLPDTSYNTCPVWSPDKLSLVVDPDGDVHEYHYSVFLYGHPCADNDHDLDGEEDDADTGFACDHPWQSNEFGLPFTRRFGFASVDPSLDPVYLSEVTYEDCAGHLAAPIGSYVPGQDPLPAAACATGRKRSRYVGYQTYNPYQVWSASKDPEQTLHLDCLATADLGNCFSTDNRRLQESRTVFDDDDGNGNAPPEGVFRNVLNLHWNGLGNHRRVKTTGNWSSGIGNRVSKVEFTRYTAASGVVTRSNPPTGFPGGGQRWLLDLYDLQRSIQSGQVSQTDFCFDPATGKLEGLRRLASFGSNAYSPHDTLIRFHYDDENLGDPESGNLVSEEVFGGDGQTLPSGCAQPTMPPIYRRDHHWQDGTLRSTTLVDPAQPGDPQRQLLITDNRAVDPSSGRVTEAADANGLRTQAGYDRFGRLTLLAPVGGSPEDRDDPVTHEYRDYRPGVPARVKTVSGPVGGEVETAVLFGGFGQVAENRRKLPTGDWSDSRVRYFADGLERQRSQPRVGTETLHWTVFRYDAFGRVTETKAPDLGKVIHGYTGDRATSTEVDYVESLSGGIKAAFSGVHRDPFGRIYKVTEERKPFAGSPKHIATYVHDVNDRLIQANLEDTGTSSTVQKRFFDYDARGFLLSEDHPEVDGVWQHSAFGPLGNRGRSDLLPGSGPAARSLGFEHDRFGRPTRTLDLSVSPAQPLTQLFYGTASLDREGGEDDDNLAVGKLVASVSHNSGGQVMQAFRYAGVEGRPSTLWTRVVPTGSFAEEPKEFQLDVFYDGQGNVEEIHYPTCVGGRCEVAGPMRRVLRTFDRGYLTRIEQSLDDGASWTDILSSQTYHSNRVLAGRTFGNGTQEVHERDPQAMARPHRIQVLDASSAALWDSGIYTFDARGDITAIGPDRFAYDMVSRLTEADYPADGASQTVDYDRWGNITSLSSTLPPGVPDAGTDTRTFAVDPFTNRLDNPSWFGYDEAGNLTKMFDLDAVFDPLDRLQALTGPGVSKRFLYDTGGERIVFDDDHGGEVPGSTRNWTLRGLDGQVLRTYRDGGGGLDWDRDYIPGDSGALASIVETDLVGPGSAEELRIHHRDHLGSVRLITGPAGDVVEEHKYLPFGEQVTPRPPGERFKFAGHERDLGCETCEPSVGRDDLDYMHARYYSPYLGRFAGVDPVLGTAEEPQGWNRYGYAGGNPLARVDPDGRSDGPPSYLTLGDGCAACRLAEQRNRKIFKAVQDEGPEAGAAKLRELGEGLEGPAVVATGTLMVASLPIIYPAAPGVFLGGMGANLAQRATGETDREAMGGTLTGMTVSGISYGVAAPASGAVSAGATAGFLGFLAPAMENSLDALLQDPVGPLADPVWGLPYVQFIDEITVRASDQEPVEPVPCSSADDRSNCR